MQVLLILWHKVSNPDIPKNSTPWSRWSRSVGQVVSFLDGRTLQHTRSAKLNRRTRTKMKRHVSCQRSSYRRHGIQLILVDTSPATRHPKQQIGHLWWRISKQAENGFTVSSCHHITERLRCWLPGE